MRSCEGEYADKFESVAIAEPCWAKLALTLPKSTLIRKLLPLPSPLRLLPPLVMMTPLPLPPRGTAFVFMGHGTSGAKISYSQMQMTMQTLGYDNVFIGTVEERAGRHRLRGCDRKDQGSRLHQGCPAPLDGGCGDHANNDMAGDDADSWLSQFKAAGCFDSVDTQITRSGRNC